EAADGERRRGRGRERYDSGSAGQGWRGRLHGSGVGDHGGRAGGEPGGRTLRAEDRSGLDRKAPGTPKTGGLDIAQPRVGERVDMRPQAPEGAPKQPRALQLLSVAASAQLA